MKKADRERREREVERMAAYLHREMYLGACMSWRDLPRPQQERYRNQARYVLRLLAAERRKAARSHQRAAVDAISQLATPSAGKQFERGYDRACREAIYRVKRAILRGPR